MPTIDDNYHPNVVKMDEYKVGYWNFNEWKSDEEVVVGEYKTVSRKVPGSNEEV